MAGLDLTGRTAIVTGASRGIGLAVAEALAAAGGERGAHLPLPGIGRRGAARRGRPGQRALGVGAHAVDEEAARRCVDLTLERFGSLDILVNNAGTNPAYGPLIDQDHARFAKTFDVNSGRRCCGPGSSRSAWMGEHGGAVVNTASIGGMACRAEPRPVQRVQGRADPPHQAAGPGARAEGPRQRRRAGRGAHPAGRGCCGRSTSRPSARVLGRSAASASPHDVAAAVAFLASDAARGSPARPW